MPLANYRTINGERWRLYGVFSISGNASIVSAKRAVEQLHKNGVRTRREKNVVYVYSRKI
jgi:hypothetical protein